MKLVAVLPAPSFGLFCSAPLDALKDELAFQLLNGNLFSHARRDWGEVSSHLRYPKTYKYPTPSPANSDGCGMKNIEKIAINTKGYHLDLIWIGRQQSPLGISGY